MQKSWLDKTNLTYNGFYGSPFYKAQLENKTCATIEKMDDEYRWNYEDCTKERHFVCKIVIKTCPYTTKEIWILILIVISVILLIIFVIYKGWFCYWKFGHCGFEEKQF